MRWLQRPRRTTHRVWILRSLEAQLERFYAGSVTFASMDEPVFAALVEQVLADDELHIKLLTSPRAWNRGRRPNKVSGTPASVGDSGGVGQSASGARQAQGFAPGSSAFRRGDRDRPRRRAVESAKDAEVLLRWLSRPRSSPSGLGLEEMGDEELEGLYAGLLRLARLEEDELARLLSSS